MLNYAKGLDGLSILFIVLSTSNNSMYLTSPAIHMEKRDFLLIIYY